MKRQEEDLSNHETFVAPRPLRTELAAIPEYIAAEVFLENSGFFTPSSKRIKYIYVKEKKVGEKIEPDGTTRTITTKISANHELGLPVTSDFDYYRAFLKICDEIVDRDGRFKLPIAVPTKKILRYAGKSENARYWREVHEWLRRLTFTGIEGGIYQAKTKDYQEKFYGTVFSQVVVAGERMRNNKFAETNYVWPSPWFLSNYYHRHLRPLDVNFHYRLRKPIAKSLYPLLETGWYATDGDPYSKSYRDLCAEFLLTSYRQISRIKQQLDPSHYELQEEKFLDRWEYRRGADRNNWIITYWPGCKFFDDQKARLDRRARAEQLILDFSTISQSQEMVKDDDIRRKHLLEDILEVCGDAENRAAYQKVMRTYPMSLIEMTLSETRQAYLEGRVKKNKGAYFMDTIKRLSELRQEAQASCNSS